jgi:flagellar motor protein MotB
MPALTGGIIVAIGVRGHADQDLLKTGHARLEFEQRVSEERAKEVAGTLLKAIKAKASRLVSGLLPHGDMFEPAIEGMGARMLLKNPPVNEYERSLNRRVEIFFLRDWVSLAQMGDFDIPAQKSF